MVKAFIVKSKDLLNKRKNPKLSLSPIAILNNRKVPKIRLKSKNIVYCEKCQKMTETKLHKDKNRNDYMTCRVCGETK